MNILFTETQKFSFWWLWLLLGSITLLPIYGIYKQVILGVPFGSKPSSDLVLYFTLLLMLAVLFLFWKMVLKTEITDDYISIKFYPFVDTRFQWSDIISREIVNYGFVGYGIRIGTTYGTVYNTRGNKGLSIQLKNGKKYCIGTQREVELKSVIDQMNQNKSDD